MVKALTVSQAKPKLGRLLDQAGAGQEVYLRRKERLYRVELVTEIEPIPHRPFGYFNTVGKDPLDSLINAAPASFTPLP